MIGPRPYVIKELKISENDDITGVSEISFVESPAIEVNFDVFKKISSKDRKKTTETKYKFTAYPDAELKYDDKGKLVSHPFCQVHAGKTYTQSQINTWVYNPNSKVFGEGWINDKNFFQTFGTEQWNGAYDGQNQLFNCRHRLKKVNNFEEEVQEEQIYLELSDEEKRIVKGPVLISGKMIYRSDLGNGTSGFVWFSRDTVRTAHRRYGFNRTISVGHKDDFTGSAILLDSYLEENEETKQTVWMCSYKIIGEQLWQFIKAKKCLGFSVQAIFSV